MTTCVVFFWSIALVQYMHMHCKLLAPIVVQALIISRHGVQDHACTFDGCGLQLKYHGGKKLDIKDTVFKQRPRKLSSIKSKMDRIVVVGVRTGGNDRYWESGEQGNAWSLVCMSGCCFLNVTI